ncbi:MAG: hypothetical protein AAF378_13890 [Cyanobacteria bacterium P01_A01_bin.84]
MNGNFRIILGALAMIAVSVSSVNAQLSQKTSSDSDEYSTSGKSLTGIDTISAENDFDRFFVGNKSLNSRNELNSDLNPSLVILNTPIILQPAENFVNGNDGLQVQFDLRNVDK